MDLSSAQTDRAAGVLLTQACGDALGVPYEFGPQPTGSPVMVGGGLGNYAPGEWSDDTQMAVCIAQVTAQGMDLTHDGPLDAVAERFHRWLDSNPADIGIQTRTVLRDSRQTGGDPAATAMTDVARGLHERTGHTAGNGALMRTGVVGLTHLAHREATAASARRVAELTHADPLAGDSCVLLSEAVRVAVIEARLDLPGGLDLLPVERQSDWQRWIGDAQACHPTSFSANGFTVTALQAAWSAIYHTGQEPEGPMHVRAALEQAITIGHDTDTVAAITGALLGARHGASALPFEWTRLVHGWPGLRARDLVRLAVLTARGGQADGSGWPAAARMDTGYERRLAVPHPTDPGVLLGTMADLAAVEELGVDAVVSLCRLGTQEHAPAGIAARDHAEFWLIDSDDPLDNQHLHHVLDEAAKAVHILRSEGKRVLLHCVAAQHRTPAVALRYALLLGQDPHTAAAQITTVLDSPGIEGLLWKQAHHVI